MRVIIAGATGFIGKELCREFCKNYEVIALSRDVARATETLNGLAQVIQWDAETVGQWTKVIDGAFAVINLCGENIGEGRWNEAKKKRILHSRLDSSKVLAEAIKKAADKPKVVILASAIGFYGSRGDEPLDEDSALGRGFLASVCRQVEDVSKDIETANVRCVAIRSGVVLGSGGGILAKLVQLFRAYMGGYLGNGMQWSSWISLEDEINAIRFLMENDSLRGAFDLTSPQPIRMKEFCDVLGKVLSRPSWSSVPTGIVRLAFGEMADELLLASQKVLPKRLSQAGFAFKHPDLEGTLRDILG